MRAQAPTPRRVFSECVLEALGRVGRERGYASAFVDEQLDRLAGVVFPTSPAASISADVDCTGLTDDQRRRIERAIAQVLDETTVELAEQMGTALMAAFAGVLVDLIFPASDGDPPDPAA